MKLFLSVFLIIFLSCLAANGANSPIDKGSVKFGGSLLFMNLSGDIYGGDGDGITAFAFTPGIEFFTSARSSFGIDLILLNLSSDTRYGNYDIKGWGISPSLGFYFGSAADSTNIKGKYYPYGKISFSYLSGEIDNIEGSIIRIGLKGGLNIMITDNAALDVGIQYSLDSFKSKGGNTSDKGSGIWFGGGLSCFIWR